MQFGEDLIICIGKSEKGSITKTIHLDKPLNCEPFSIEARPIHIMEVLDKSDYLLVNKKQGMFKSREKKGFQHLLSLTMKE
jgi:hypothetical protein